MENKMYYTNLKNGITLIETNKIKNVIIQVITNDLDTKELLKLKELIEDRIADRKDGGYN
tara:strand:+ start:510 stop:689 length:180 start_codon:yes stop_codon:yes gene_type:complete